MNDAPSDPTRDNRTPTAVPVVPPPRAVGNAAAALAGEQAGGHRTDEVEGLYRLLVDSVRDYAIFALDSTGHVLSWNPGAQRFNGYTQDEILGKHFSVFYPPEDQWKPPMELDIATATGRFEEEGWRLRKDGSRFWASVVITALRDTHGTLVGFAKVTRDLTERKLSEQQRLEDARRVAISEEANRAKAGFLAAMSHELRTPLNAIAGYTDLLLTGVGGAVSEQHRDYLERIRGSQQHLLAIINDILNFSRIEAGQLEYRVEPVSVRAVINAVVPMVEPQALAKSIAIEWHDNTDAVASADHAKVEQILLNLLSNAVKFTPAGGHIDVGCAAREDRVTLTVSDSGIGIAAEDLAAIFQPFVQVGRSLTSPHEGTGLGLAISSDLATGMGGRLDVESAVGVGSTFTLTLPSGKGAPA
jgi:PAS domain S-box-containing protein